MHTHWSPHENCYYTRFPANIPNRHNFQSNIFPFEFNENRTESPPYQQFLPNCVYFQLHTTQHMYYTEGTSGDSQCWFDMLKPSAEQSYTGEKGGGYNFLPSRCLTSLYQWLSVFQPLAFPHLMRCFGWIVCRTPCCMCVLVCVRGVHVFVCRKRAQDNG